MGGAVSGLGRGDAEEGAQEAKEEGIGARLLLGKLSRGRSRSPAGRAAEAGTEAGIAACEAGTGENEVAAAIHDAQIRAGSEYTGLPVFITSGPRSALAHATWYRQQMSAGDTVFLEIPCCINRYHAVLMRTVHIGEPPEAMGAALQATIEFIKPGITAHEAHRFCEGFIADAGLGVALEHRAAYSIGIAFAPDWGEGNIISMMEGEHSPLQAGMTFHLIPQVFIPGLSGVGVSEIIHVTDDGCESLTPNIDRRLFVA